MAGRLLNRRALREEHDQVEEVEQVEDDSDDGEEAAEPKPKAKKPRAKKAAVAKAPAKPRVRKKTVKAPPRMVARWAVCDGGLKRVALFEYKDRAGADAKLADLQERKSGTFVLQLVKEVYNPPPEAEEGAPTT
jgi:hypothetical protein